MERKLRNNGQNVPQFSGKHKLTDPRSSMSLKEDKDKESHTWTHHEQIPWKMKTEGAGEQTGRKESYTQGLSDPGDGNCSSETMDEKVMLKAHNRATQNAP